MKKLLIGLLLLFPFFIYNQIKTEQYTISDDYLGWWARCIADINGDGLQDLVVAKQSRAYESVTPGWLGWFEAKDGGKRWEKKVIEHNNLYGSGDLDADIDKDGDVDIFSLHQ